MRTKNVLGKLYPRYADELEKGKLRALDVETKPAKFLENLIKHNEWMTGKQAPTKILYDFVSSIFFHLELCG